MSENLDLSLRITADLNRAREELKNLSGDVSTLAQSVNKADEQWQNAGNAVTQSSKAFDEARAKQQEYLDAELIKAAQQRELKKEQMAAAEAAKKQRVENEKLGKELQTVLSKIDPVTRAFAKLDEQEEKLRKMNRAGIINNDAFDSYLSKINAQRNAIDLLTGKTQTLQVNSKAARNELVLLLRQLASGNISGAAQNFYNLGSRVGALPGLFSLAGASVAGVLSLLVATGATLITLSRDQDSFTRSLISTGNYAALSAGQLEVMAQKAGKLSSNYGAARDILNGLIKNGKLTQEALSNAAEAAASLAEITGRSADQIVGEFSRLSDSASGWANEMDDKYRLLDIATLERIRSLENQGKKEEAIELASAEINRALKGRINELREELSGLAAGWENVKRVVNEIKQGFRTGVSIATGQDTDFNKRAREIEELQKRLDGAGDESEIARRGPVYAQLVARDRERLEQLKQQEVAENLRASALAESNRIADEGKTAYKELNDLWDKNKTAIEKEAAEIESLRLQYEKLWATEDGREILQARGVQSDDGKEFSGGQWESDAGRLSESTKAAAKYNEQLERTLNTSRGLTQVEKTQAEIRSGSLKDATEEEQQKALALAKRVDAQNKALEKERQSQQQVKKSAGENQRYVDSLVNQAAKQNQSAAAIRANEIATRNLTEEQKKAAQAAHELLTAREYADQNFTLRMQLIRASGDEAGASLEEVRKKYSDLKRDFESSGNTEGLALIDKLLPVEETKIRIDQIKKEVEDLYNYQSQREQSIQAQITTGAISEYNGRQQILELHKQTAEKLQEYLPVLREMSDIPGEAGENIRALLGQLDTQLATLSQSGNELTQAFKDGLQSGLESSIIGLANGTMSLSDAVKNLALEIVNSMARIAAQQLAMGAMSALGGGAGLGALFFSDGGQVRGAGTNTSDSIPAYLSDEEFVTRAAVVKEPGALEFLDEFNERGMAALDDRARAAASTAPPVNDEGFLTRSPLADLSVAPDVAKVRLSDEEYVTRSDVVRESGALDFLTEFNRRGMAAIEDWTGYASGGLTGFPAQSTPSDVPELAAPERAAETPQTTISQTLVLDAGEVMSAGVNTVAGQRSLITWVRANKSTLKQMITE
ncbi:phage tail length tape measure family protein [Klebsiella oxytoca]|uniref:phage tail length tape measure family protein n=1 Tax=Klebsiella oxytoca TaxID=571 RepID=UPI003A928C6F